MTLLGEGGCVAGGAAIASALTVKLGDPVHGYSLGGVVPLSLGIGGLFYGLSFLTRKSRLGGIFRCAGHGAVAAYAGGVGRTIGQGKFSLLGTGAIPEEQYARLLETRDHRRAA